MNTKPLPRCPQCGVPVPTDAPGGLCPRCVLGGVASQAEVPSATGTLSDPPALDVLQAAFPQLEILECVGRGGMGVVYRARQPRLNRLVALKLLAERLSLDPAFAGRFEREGQALARLNHPNIVAVHDFGQAGGFFYLLMEYVDGVNLRQAMASGRFSPGEALNLVPQICSALQYAHEQGILHRDIKPENILLDARGQVKLADFGIAKLTGEESAPGGLTVSGMALGTPNYMAPEQIERPAEVDHRADIYSLGVVFYELLTGELPLGRFQPPSAKAPLDERIDAIVLRALAKERELRQQSADEVRQEVEHLPVAGVAAPRPGAAPAAGTTQPGAPEHVRRGNRRLKALLAVAALASLTLMLAWPRLGNRRSGVVPPPVAEGRPMVQAPLKLVLEAGDGTPRTRAELRVVAWQGGVPRDVTGNHLIFSNPPAGRPIEIEWRLRRSESGPGDFDLWAVDSVSGASLTLTNRVFLGDGPITSHAPADPLRLQLGRGGVRWWPFLAESAAGAARIGSPAADAPGDGVSIDLAIGRAPRAGSGFGVTPELERHPLEAARVREFSWRLDARCFSHLNVRFPVLRNGEVQPSGIAGMEVSGPTSGGIGLRLKARVPSLGRVDRGSLAWELELGDADGAGREPLRMPFKGLAAVAWRVVAGTQLIEVEGAARRRFPVLVGTEDATGPEAPAVWEVWCEVELGAATTPVEVVGGMPGGGMIELGFVDVREGMRDGRRALYLELEELHSAGCRLQFEDGAGIHPVTVFARSEAGGPREMRRVEWLLPEALGEAGVRELIQRLRLDLGRTPLRLGAGERRFLVDEVRPGGDAGPLRLLLELHSVPVTVEAAGAMIRVW